MSTADIPGAGGHGIARATGLLHTVLDEVTGCPVWSMTPAEQKQVLVGLTRAQARLDELRLRVLAAADISKVGADTAAASTGAWLADATRLTPRTANAEVNLARALDGRYAATGTALAAGRLLTEQARVIIDCLDDLSDQIPAAEKARAEAHLIDQAELFDAKELRLLARKLFETLDPDEAERREGEKLQRQEEEARRKCYLKLHPNGDGTYSGRFKLPTLHAELLNKALLGLTAAHRLGDARLDADGKPFPGHRLLGQGFCELIEHFPTDGLPNVRKNAVRLIITMELDKLLSGLGAATLDTGGRISAGEARRLACEAGIIPVVLGGPSVILDQGRDARYYDDNQEIAMTVRDQHCTTRGCDRPASLCHKHHDKPWSQGGRTDLKDGRLLCPWHHSRAHDSRYQMTTHPDNQVTFTRRT